MPDEILSSPKGLKAALEEQVSPDEVADDVDGEAEAHDAEAWTSCTRSHAAASIHADALTTIENAAKGVTDQTELEYRRLMDSFNFWLTKEGYIREGESIFDGEPPEQTPTYIAMWILQE